MKNLSGFQTGTLVFIILFCSYILTFTGVSSTDDEQLFAVLTTSLAERGEYDALPLFGNDRIRGNAGGVEPLHPLLGVPLYLAAKSAGLGAVQVLHLLPGFYTALCGALLVIIAYRRGYSRRTSALIGLIFGLSSIAFPYARTNFREPLAALCISAALFFLEDLRIKNQRWQSQLMGFVLMLTCLSLSVLVKVTTFICLPIFIMGTLRVLEKKGDKQPLLLFPAILILSVVAALGLFALDRIIPSAGLVRLSREFLKYLFRTVPRLPHDHFWRAAAGILVSPGKGLFVYSPIVLIAFFKISGKRKTADGLIALGTLLGFTAVQALAYDKSWWTITWSVRALLPALPPLMLLCLPVLDRLLSAARKRESIFLYSIVFLGFSIQLGRILVSDPAYAGWAVREIGSEISASSQWSFHLMPLWRHWWLFFQCTEVDIAWQRLVESLSAPLILTVYTALTVIILSAFFLIRGKPPNWRFQALLLLLMSMLIPLALFTAGADLRYYGYVDSYREAANFICARADEGDLLLLDAYLEPPWWYFYNFGCREIKWIGLPYEHARAFSGDRFYPRTAELKPMLFAARQEGVDIFLLESPDPTILAYHQELDLLGFMPIKLEEFISPDNPTVVVYRVY